MTKKFALVLILTVCSSVVVMGQGRKVRFDPDGSFWILGEHPDGFLDFGGIDLNNKNLRRLPKQGLSLNSGKNFRFKNISLKQDHFTFTTVSLSNISYSFSGRFLRGGVFESADFDDETPVLEGLLTKYKAGQKVAEARLKFVYFGGT